MTPYNFAASVGRALDAGATHLLDPGSGGTVTVAPKGESILVLSSAGARTLQAAAGVDLGSRVRAYATIAGTSVNGVTLEDGGYAVFEVTLSAAGANQWSLVTLLPATVPVDLGTVSISITDATTEAAVVALFDALVSLGLVSGTWTAAP